MTELQKLENFQKPRTRLPKLKTGLVDEEEMGDREGRNTRASIMYVLFPFIPLPFLESYRTVKVWIYRFYVIAV